MPGGSLDTGSLILTIRPGDNIQIDEVILIEILRFEHGKALLRIVAPKDKPIHLYRKSKGPLK